MNNWVLVGGAFVARTARRYQAGTEAIELFPIIWPGNTNVQPTDAIIDRIADKAARDNRTRNILTALAIIASVAAPFVIGYATRLYVAHVKYIRKVYREHEERLHKQLRDAIATTHEMKFPATLLAARDFLKLGTLKSHEELRDRGLLLYHDVLDDLLNSPERLVFFSHQWTAFKYPDPTGKQYASMVAALNHIVDTEKWDLDATWIWVDYFSIPQANHDIQSLAIRSLTAYASLADAFCIVAPEVAHSDTGKTCDATTCEST